MSQGTSVTIGVTVGGREEPPMSEYIGDMVRFRLIEEV
jgi:hypothetical protein